MLSDREGQRVPVGHDIVDGSNDIVRLECPDGEGKPPIVDMCASTFQSYESAIVGVAARFARISP